MDYYGNILQTPRILLEMDSTQRHLLNISETEYRLIDVIATNKSLPETEQWKIKADKAFKNFKKCYNGYIIKQK